ncbi:MAG: hypothetical protein WBG70_08860 [Spirulinaceae cyanobacterium]
MGFRDDNNSKNYFGVWIDESTLTGGTQAIIIAVRKWLEDNLTDDNQRKIYIDFCKRISKAEGDLAKAIRSLEQYSLQNKQDCHSASSYAKKALDSAIAIKQELSATNGSIFKELYEKNLERKLAMAYLVKARIAHTEGNIILGREKLNCVKKIPNKFKTEYVPVGILNEVENLNARFLSGNREFLDDEIRIWQKQIERYLEELRDYIYTERLEVGNYQARFDFDVYLAVTEVFGNIALFNFYCCKAQDFVNPEDHIKYFLFAAHYSAKIGQKQKTASWLAYISRLYCRLGDKKKAESFCEVAEDILTTAIEPLYSLRYRESIFTETHLAKGEKLLLIDREPSLAVVSFLKALNGSIYIGFARLIADSFYGIARASKHLGNHRIGKSFRECVIFNDALQEGKLWLDENKQSWQENKIAANALKFLNELDLETCWSDVSNQFKQEAKNIWHGWYLDSNLEGEHPFEKEIEEELFLGYLGQNSYPKQT